PRRALPPAPRARRRLGLAPRRRGARRPKRPAAEPRARALRALRRRGAARLLPRVVPRARARRLGSAPFEPERPRPRRPELGVGLLPARAALALPREDGHEIEPREVLEEAALPLGLAREAEGVPVRAVRELAVFGVVR